MNEELKKDLKTNIKMAAFDVDGTILPFGNPTFSDGIKQMFKDLQKNGIYSIISTAREFITIGNLLTQIPEANYFIGANGMFVYDIQKAEIIYENAVKLEHMAILYEALFGKDSFANYDPSKKFADLESFTVTDLNWCYHSPGINKNTWFLTPHQAKLVPMDFAKIDPKHIHIITLGSYNQEATNRLEAYITKVIQENNLPLEVSSKWNKGVFVTPVGVTKFNALTWLAKHLNLDAKKNLITFGDSTNDFEMLKNAAFSVGLGEHEPYIKEITKMHALPVEKDGAYLALKELGLI
ncbi:YcsE-related riboflavin metabolism phosphatase [Mycoplasmopsis iners]|uniref:YcsE-related riboflavin metabolism phosphatase n=1 Tax=Mycoplasmopsis iners TaxID=76630 RepID=UPI000495ECE9|nr:HAD family hydrolase [Mycoplasmopsis iners]